MLLLKMKYISLYTNVLSTLSINNLHSLYIIHTYIYMSWNKQNIKLNDYIVILYTQVVYHEE